MTGLPGGPTPAVLAVGEDDAFAQLTTDDGAVVAASENMAGMPAIAEPPASSDGEQLVTVDGLPMDDEAFRLLSRRFDAAGDGYVLRVGAALDDVDESVGVLTMTLAITLPVVLVVVGGILWTAVGRALLRVESAHQRLERFVADASHELRSPLTSIRSELEIDLGHAGEADWRATHRSVLEDTVRLQRLVDELLFFARRDEGGAGNSDGNPDFSEKGVSV